MNFLRIFFQWLFLRRRAESDMEQELQFHLESRVADLQRRGLSSTEAKRQARMEFGSLDAYKEDIREARGLSFFDDIRTDFSFALRVLKNNRGLTANMIVSLALGIGMSLSTFAALYFMVLRPFPYPDLGRIAILTTRANSLDEPDRSAPANYLDWKQSNHSFENIAAYRAWDVRLAGLGDPDFIRAAQVSAEFFQVLGISPELGRVFTAAEYEDEHSAVVVISHDFWQSHRSSMLDPIGKVFSLGNRNYKVIGVMPAKFDYPLAAALWSPLALSPDERAERSRQELTVVGKLKSNISLIEASADINRITRQSEDRYPRTHTGRQVVVTPLRSAALASTGNDHFLTVLMFAALFVLLLACTNVSSLQIARAMVRKKEFGLRTALGADFFRIIRLLVIESGIVGFTGGILGVALAIGSVRAIISNVPAFVYQLAAGIKSVRISAELAVFGILFAIFASLLCYAPAAIHLYAESSADWSRGLKENVHGIGVSLVRSRFRTALIIFEVALTLVLLVGAGLMINTFQKLLAVNVGSEIRNVLAADVSLSKDQYRQSSTVVGFYDRVLKKIERNHDLIAVSALGGAEPESETVQPVFLEKRTATSLKEPMPKIHATTSGYLDVLQIPLTKGRWISDQDGPDSLPVAVLSASIARRYWSSSDPIGQRIKVGSLDSPWLTVVGVVGDVDDWFSGTATPEVYLSYRQFPQASMQLLVRSFRDPRELSDELRMAVAEIDQSQIAYNIRTLEQQRSDETSGLHNSAIMMGTYAAVALLLAVAGVYSVGSFFVAQRSYEIGVRLTLGATRKSILKMVMSQSCWMTGAGLLIGAPLAIFLTIAMSHMLFNIVVIRPADFIFFTFVLGGTSMLASFIPAYQAVKVDPINVLRHE